MLMPVITTVCTGIDENNEIPRDEPMTSQGNQR